MYRSTISGTILIRTLKHIWRDKKSQKITQQELGPEITCEDWGNMVKTQPLPQLHNFGEIFPGKMIPEFFQDLRKSPNRRDNLHAGMDVGIHYR